ADGTVHPRILYRRFLSRVAVDPSAARQVRSLQTQVSVGEHPTGRPRGQALPPSRPELFRPATRSRLRVDAGDRPVRRVARNAARHIRNLVDPADVADRSRTAEPPGEPEPAPLARTRPAPAGE